MSARRWGTAGLVSVGVHAALLAGLAWAVRPDPAPRQEPGATRLDLAAYRVPESDAVPEALPEEAAPEAQGEGPRLDGTAIPISRARAAVLPEGQVLAGTVEAQAVQAAEAAGAAVTASARQDAAVAVLAPPAPVTQAVAGAGVALAPAEAASPAVAYVPPPREALDPVSAPIERLAGRAPPGENAGEIAASPQAVAPVRQGGDALAAAQPRASALTQVAPPSEAAQAVTSAAPALAVSAPEGALAGEVAPEGQRAPAVVAPGAVAAPVAVLAEAAVPVAAARPEVAATQVAVVSSEVAAAVAPADRQAVAVLSEQGAPLRADAPEGQSARVVTAPLPRLEEVTAPQQQIAEVAAPQPRLAATAAPRQQAPEVAGPQQRLAEATTPQVRVAAVAAPNGTIAAIAAPQATVAAVAAPQVQVAAGAPEAVVLAAMRAAPAAAQVLAPSAGPAGAAVVPAGVPLAASRASPPRVAPAPAAGAPVAPAPAQGPQAQAAALPSRPASGPAAGDLATGAPAQVLPAMQTTAALAWSGAQGDLDPVSLAAIQSFLRPGDAVAQADPVRDAVGQLLASVPCARLQTTFVPETGQLELRGHIPEEGLRAPVLAALQAQMGSDIPVADNLLILPRPQCGALEGIAGVGLPQSDEQESNPRIVGAGTHARVYGFHAGQKLRFDLQGPDYPAYFYVDYFDADGMVLHLQPNPIVPLLRIGVAQQVLIGESVDGAPALDITVTPPFGQEILVAFAASVPLYAGLRPVQEPAAPYLEALKEMVAEARAAHPDFKGEWVYFFVSTAP